MESTVTEKPTHDSGKRAFETQVSSENYSRGGEHLMIDFVLRVLLFAATVVAVVVMVTSKQTEFILLPQFPSAPLPRPAKFNHSPAFIYFVAALSVAGLYSILTTLTSFMAMSKSYPAKHLLFYTIITDTLMLGLVASATGSAGAVGYIGLKGNKHVQWLKVCKIYDKFCRHVGSSIFISLFASVLLVLLIILSTTSLYRQVR